MTFDISIIGYMAGTCTAIAQFPQAYKVYKTKETHSISPVMYIVMTTGIFFWFIYGWLLPDLPMIIANGTCLVPSIYTIVVMLGNIRRANKKSI